MPSLSGAAWMVRASRARRRRRPRRGLLPLLRGHRLVLARARRPGSRLAVVLGAVARHGGGAVAGRRAPRCASTTPRAATCAPRSASPPLPAPLRWARDAAVVGRERRPRAAPVATCRGSPALAAVARGARGLRARRHGRRAGSAPMRPAACCSCCPAWNEAAQHPRRGRRAARRPARGRHRGRGRRLAGRHRRRRRRRGLRGAPAALPPRLRRRGPGGRQVRPAPRLRRSWSPSTPTASTTPPTSRRSWPAIREGADLALGSRFLARGSYRGGASRRPAAASSPPSPALSPACASATRRRA